MEFIEYVVSVRVRVHIAICIDASTVDTPNLCFFQLIMKPGNFSPHPLQAENKSKNNLRKKIDPLNRVWFINCSM